MPSRQEARAAAEPIEPIEPEVEGSEPIIDDPADSGDDNKPEDDGKPVEPWMMDDEAEKKKLDGTVPASTHIGMKQKLKGRLSEKEDKIANLEREIEQLKAGRAAPAAQTQTLVRPKQEDFDSDEEYYAALERYDDKRLEERFNRLKTQDSQNTQAKTVQEKVSKAVDDHYNRAATLVSESGIDPDLYRQADENFRAAIERIIPGKGDIIADHLISIMGKGSEKVGFYVGNNKAAMNEFKALLAEDNSGLKASLFLGAQKQRLINSSTGKRSSAPPPAPEINVGFKPSDSSRAKKEYDSAHKKGDGSSAFTIRRQAKKAGIDVSGWK